MFSATILLLLNGIFFMLRLSGGNGSFPKPLNAEEEQEYLQRFSAGDMQARNILIERNLRLVAHIIKKYYTQANDQDDLISIGTIGLIKGISSYNPGKGVRLATYAARCIENAILLLRHPASFGKGKANLVCEKLWLRADTIVYFLLSSMDYKTKKPNEEIPASSSIL